MLYLDATYLPTRPSGAKEGVLVASGYDETRRRVLPDVVLGQRERFEDWLEMGRGLVRRGLRAPMLVVTPGFSPGDGGAVAGRRPPDAWCITPTSGSC